MAEKKEKIYVSDNARLMKEWNWDKNTKLGYDPTALTLGIGRIKPWWKCDKGHEWEDTILHRSQGRNCPYCSNHRVQVGYNDLFTTNPELESEWDYAKNTTISPMVITAGSGEKVWWICRNGHSFRSAVHVRTQGSGCPYCSNREILAGYNDLATTNPELAQEWNWNKNKGISPTQIGAGSSRRVWWICEKGHEWESSANNRTGKNGSGCPYCSNRKVLVGFNDLASVNPTLASEWHPEMNGNLKPQDVVYGSNKKVWWKCKKGHQWQAAVATRLKGHGCPYCSGRIATQENNLELKAPWLVSEWHPTKNGDLLPSMISPYSSKKVWWKCKRGHEWQASVSNRFQGRNCAQCSAELKTSFPEQAIVFYLTRYFNVECRNKYNGWEIDIYLPDYNIGIEYDGVAYHSKDFLVEREKRKSSDLQAAGIDLIRIKENYVEEKIENQTIWFIVDHNYKNFPSTLQHLLSLLQKKTGITIDNNVDIERDRVEILSQYTSVIKKNSFSEKYPELCKFWNYSKNNDLTPAQFTYMSNRKLWWKCPQCNGEWQESIINVAKGNRCPYCSGHKVLKGFNDLKTLKPEIALEWDYKKNQGISPDEFTVGSSRYVWWKCKNGHSWKAQIATRSKECPHCTGRHRVKPLNNAQWMRKYHFAKGFFEKYGHLDVPAKYVCDNGLQLGMWIRTQRGAKKSGTLTEEREQLLNEIGMKWQLQRGVKKK